MVRYWITMAHASCLVASAALLANDGVPLCTASDAVTLTVGELAERIWRLAGPGGETEIELLGIRRGETLSEVLTGPGEELGPERYQGIAPIEGEIPTAAAAWVVERLPERGSRADARAIWLEAMQRPGLLSPGRVESRAE
jgi:FlaA1/EpsC-like NDP-sugar epimerase